MSLVLQVCVHTIHEGQCGLGRQSLTTWNKALQKCLRLHSVSLTKIKKRGKREETLQSGTCSFKVHENKLAWWSCRTVYTTLQRFLC